MWYEPLVIAGSMVVFMVYFFFLREESDLDNEFARTLYSRIEGLEEQQLRLVLKHNTDHGLPTEQIRERLQELEKEKAEKEAESTE